MEHITPILSVELANRLIIESLFAVVGLFGQPPVQCDAKISEFIMYVDTYEMKIYHHRPDGGWSKRPTTAEIILKTLQAKTDFTPLKFRELYN